MSPMELNEYQIEAERTRGVYATALPQPMHLVYTALGLSGEAGEVANKVKKVYRDGGGVISADAKRQLKDELGDVLWYVAMMAYELAVTLDDVAAFNVGKLRARHLTGAGTGGSA
jgi:NTP pyrophosphatase (non-canonical NTP hydrolase)